MRIFALQMDVRSAEALERIATAQLVMAVIMVLVGLAVIGEIQHTTRGVNLGHE